jgi:hypothetical protein
MRKIAIALGCGGVLGDYTTAILRVVEEVTGRRPELGRKSLPVTTKALGLSTEEEAAVKKALCRRGFVTSILPYPQARQGVRLLRGLGEVACVTTPWDGNPWWHDERDAWLALHFGIDHVHHISDKAVHEADVFVDDKSACVRAWLAAWPGRTAVLWRTPHNMEEPAPLGAFSLNSWEALYQVALEVARGPVQPLPPPTPNGGVR